MAKTWKKGRGKLGFLQPLLGRWVAETVSEMGPVRCERTLEPVVGGAFVQVTARWEIGGTTGSAGGAGAGGGGAGVRAGGTDRPRIYEELALIGPGEGGKVRFWSFTSDGKRSEGVQADVSDLHPEAVGFEAEMPQGLARMAYWPQDDGFNWLVQAKTARGWRDVVLHRYRPATADGGRAPAQ